MPGAGPSWPCAGAIASTWPTRTASTATTSPRRGATACSPAACRCTWVRRTSPSSRPRRTATCMPAASPTRPASPPTCARCRPRRRHTTRCSNGRDDRCRPVSPLCSPTSSVPSCSACANGWSASAARSWRCTDTDSRARGIRLFLPGLFQGRHRVTDSNDSRPRRPRLRAHCIAPLPAAALGLGFAASSLAGTSAPVDAVDDHFDVVVRARADGQPVPAGNVLANDSGGQAALVAQSASYIFGGLRVTLAPDGALSTQLLNACNVSDGPVPYTATDTVSTDSANAFFHFLPPVAADAYSTPIDQVLLGDIGTNDPFHGDPNYNLLSYVLVGQGHLGNVNLQLNGQFGYTPQGGNSGHDQFLYQLVNKDACSNVVYQVDVDVFPAPRPDDYYTQYLVPVSANLLANDLGNALSVVGYSQPDHGSVNEASNVYISYQSAAGFSGEDAFSYTVQDQDGLNAVAMVTLN